MRDLVSIGVSKIYKEDVVKYLKSKCSIESDVYPKMRMCLYKHPGYWVTINDQKQLREVNEFFKKKEG